MGKVIVIGSSNTDMVFRTPRFPGPGETIIGSDFSVIPGGKGANQAVAAARAGAQVVFVAKVGNDDLGRQALTGYAQDNIETRFILTDDGRPSGVAMILVDETSGMNSIVVAPGANANLLPEYLEAIAFEIQSADVLLVQLEIPLETVLRALELAAVTGVTTILNPAPARALPAHLLSLVDIITPNETEAWQLTGIAPEDADSMLASGKELLRQVRQAAIITLGEQGAYFIHQSGANHSIPTVRVNAVDSTAAGDVFNGYLAAAIADKMPFEKAIRRANLAASLSVTRPGAQPSIPCHHEIID